jgi:hypothetical protein
MHPELHEKSTYLREQWKSSLPPYMAYPQRRLIWKSVAMQVQGHRQTQLYLHSWVKGVNFNFTICAQSILWNITKSFPWFFFPVEEDVWKAIQNGVVTYTIFDDLILWCFELCFQSVDFLVSPHSRYSFSPQQCWSFSIDNLWKLCL